MFFVLSKIIGFIIDPIHFILILTITYLLLIKAKIFKAFSRFILLLISICLVFGGSDYFSNYFLWKLEQTIPVQIPEKVEGIILLGGSFQAIKTAIKLNQTSLNGSAERAVETLHLLNQYSASKVISVANSGLLNPYGPSDAKLAKEFFKKFKINENRMNIVPLANNTFQESVIISDYISQVGGNWILVTSASHMPRAVNLFQSRDLNGAVIYTYPTDYSADDPIFSLGYHLGNLGNYSKLIHEYIGLVAYRLTGRTKKIWPNLEDLPINKTNL